MKIRAVETWSESIELSQPYAIAAKQMDTANLLFVKVVAEDGRCGLGAAAPSERVTGETPEACRDALEAEVDGPLVGADARHLGAHCERFARERSATPAARAALDMALHDLYCRGLGVPLADYLGRCHDGLLTSITVGIQSVEETLAQAQEYLGQGYACLKIKLGDSFDEDEARLVRLREELGDAVPIRVDANQGYTVDETLQLEALADRYSLELIEQPLPGGSVAEMRGLPVSLRRQLAADESLLDEKDALALAGPPLACGIYNIKLMKCGGVSPALRIASIARAAGIEVMWGCNDESVISIAAALHAAYASPATRYLDLDGSLELSRDPALGGFVIRDGRMYLTGEPGLGCRLASS